MPSEYENHNRSSSQQHRSVADLTSLFGGSRVRLSRDSSDATRAAQQARCSALESRAAEKWEETTAVNDARRRRRPVYILCYRTGPLNMSHWAVWYPYNHGSSTTTEIRGSGGGGGEKGDGGKDVKIHATGDVRNGFILEFQRNHRGMREEDWPWWKELGWVDEEWFVEEGEGEGKGKGGGEHERETRKGEEERGDSQSKLCMDDDRTEGASGDGGGVVVVVEKSAVVENGEEEKTDDISPSPLHPPLFPLHHTDNNSNPNPIILSTTPQNPLERIAAAIPAPGPSLVPADSAAKRECRSKTVSSGYGSTLQSWCDEAC